MFMRVSFLVIIFTVFTSFAEDHVKYRDEKWPKSLPADQYAAQVRQNCSDLFDKLKKLMKQELLGEQDKEEIKYIERIFEAMKCTDSELLKLDHEFISGDQGIPSQEALQQHDEHDKNGWVLADRYASNRRLFCSFVLFRPLLIVGKKGVKEFSKEVEADSARLSDNDLADEERKKIQDKQNLLQIYYNVLNSALGLNNYDLDFPLTYEEKEKIEQYLDLYIMGKCADRELFKSIRYP